MPGGTVLFLACGTQSRVNLQSQFALYVGLAVASAGGDVGATFRALDAAINVNWLAYGLTPRTAAMQYLTEYRQGARHGDKAVVQDAAAGLEAAGIDSTKPGFEPPS